MSFLDIVVLSVIQGVAEFLPISSSGHLVLVGHWLGIEEAKGTLNIMLHAGTLLSILVFYFSHTLKLLKEDRRVIPLLIVGTIPAALAGVIIKKKFEWLTGDPWIAGSMLIITGIILVLSKYVRREKEVDYQETSWFAAFAIGCAQAFAILPGISRSGSTIFAGQWMGLKRESAGTFSFLLAMPIIGGATCYEMISLSSDESSSDASIGLMLAGALISFAVGYLSLRLLVSFIQKGKFHLFAWWCIPFGIISLIILAVAG